MPILQAVTALSIIIVYDHAINRTRTRNSYITRANNLSNISPKLFYLFFFRELESNYREGTLKTK